MAKTTSTSFRLSAEARRIISKLAKHFGVSRTAVLELAVRKLDKDEKSN